MRPDHQAEEAREAAVRRRNETVFNAINNGDDLSVFTAEALETAKLYTGGWAAGAKVIDAELQRRGES